MLVLVVKVGNQLAERSTVRRGQVITTRMPHCHGTLTFV